jgi:hypothetical protein
MSDIILKFWPKNDVAEIKAELLIEQLSELKIIGEESLFRGNPAYKSGIDFNDYFEPNLGKDNGYINSLYIKIAESDYGVIPGEGDFEYIDRNNVVSILGGDGTLDIWNRMVEMLTKITGDEYQGGWELL